MRGASILASAIIILHGIIFIFVAFTLRTSHCSAICVFIFICIATASAVNAAHSCASYATLAPTPTATAGGCAAPFYGADSGCEASRLLTAPLRRPDSKTRWAGVSRRTFGKGRCRRLRRRERLCSRVPTVKYLMRGAMFRPGRRRRRRWHF